MENQLILLDTSILIDYYRKTDKENSILLALLRQGFKFAVSAITRYEIYAGATARQLIFWDEVFKTLALLPVDETCIDAAVEINASLKQKRKQIDFADLLIAATAVASKLSIATLNKKHFARIEGIGIVN